MLSPVIVISSNPKKNSYYDRARLRASVITACLSVRTPEGQAENTADAVCDNFELWLKNKPEVTTKDIVTISAKLLEKYHTEAAYIYEQRHIII